MVHEARTRKIRRVLWLVLVANWAVALAKTIVGIAIHSQAVTADGLHSFIDGASNIIGLIAMYYASRPADDGHPYGHQKFEAIAALSIGAMIGLAVIELGKMAVNSIIDNVRPEISNSVLVMMVVTLFINIGVSWAERRSSRTLSSTLLAADSQHTASDVLVSIAVIASLVLSRLGVPRADGVIALVVLCLVAAAGWNIIKQAAGILADGARVNPDEVKRICSELPEVLGVHDIRSRGLAGAVYVDLKIDVDPSLTISRAHEVADKVEAAIGRSFADVVDVIVHIEPARPATSH